MMAAGLSQLARVAASAHTATSTVRKKPVAKTSAATVESFQQANLMPPPTAARHSLSGALSGWSNATPQQAEHTTRRQMVTPLTDIGAVGADAAATPLSTGLKRWSASNPVTSTSTTTTFHTTPGTHLTGAHNNHDRNVNDTPAAAPPNFATADESKVDDAAAAAAADAVNAALLAASPGTALAADILASAIGRAPVEIVVGGDASPGVNGGEPRDITEKEQLYSRFAAAATPGAGKSLKSVGAAAAAPVVTGTTTAGGSTKRKAKSVTLPKDEQVAPEGFGRSGGEKKSKISKSAAVKKGSATAAGASVAAGATAAGPTGGIPPSGPRIGTDGRDVGALHSVLLPPAKKRKARRWLTSEQKTFVCGIGGCTRAYGSASSLCAHKRAHHPGWKEERKKQQAIEAEAAAAALEAAAANTSEAGGGDNNDKGEKKDENDGGEEDEEDEDGDGEGEMGDVDVAGRAARREGAAALDADARATPSGAWIEALAADTHGRLGALRRSRQRVQRGLRDARACSAKHPPPAGGVGTTAKSAAAAAESIAAAAAARLLQQMEAALEAESERLRAWLEKLESIAELRMGVGKVLGVTKSELDCFAAAAREQEAAGERSRDHAEAAQVAAQTANAIAAAAAAAAQQQLPIQGTGARNDRAVAKMAAAVLAGKEEMDDGKCDDKEQGKEKNLGEVGAGPKGKWVTSLKGKDQPVGDATRSEGTDDHGALEHEMHN